MRWKEKGLKIINGNIKKKKCSVYFSEHLLGSIILEQRCCLQGFPLQDLQIFEPFDLNNWFPLYFKIFFILELARGLGMSPRKDIREF